MIRSVVCLCSLLMGLAGPALAQDRDAPRFDPSLGSTWSMELGGGTDNRSKGASKSGGDPFVFGEVQFNAANGFYVDAEFETIDSSGSKVETEIEAGWQGAAGGVDIDLSVSQKWRVRADPGQDDAATEVQFDLARDFGIMDARLRIEHSPDGLGSTKAWTWVETRIRWPLTTRAQAVVTVGRREQDNAPDYTGWSVGAVYALSETTELELAWHGTNVGDRGEQFDDALVLAFLVAL